MFVTLEGGPQNQMQGSAQGSGEPRPQPSSREDWLSLRSSLQVSASGWLKRLGRPAVSAAALAPVCKTATRTVSVSVSTLLVRDGLGCEPRDTE